MKNADEVQTGGSFLETAKQEQESLSTVQSSRATAEVQGAMVIAKKFPRDQNAAYDRIMTSCKRQSLAERAVYSFPRGSATVSGPSIRLAEAMAQSWGNLDFGIIELEQRRGESTVMAYCWDLETNTRQTKIFQVKHLRRKGKSNVELDDPRDIYEMTANQGARRLRACILGVIPGDIVDAAVEKCEKTLASDDRPIEDRVRDMVQKFKDFSVTIPMIEDRLGHNLAATSIHEVVQLGKIYRSIKDNMSSREDWFDVTAGEPKKEDKKRAANPPQDSPEDQLPGLPSSSGGQSSDQVRQTMIKRIDDGRKAAGIHPNTFYAELRKRHLLEDGQTVKDLTMANGHQILTHWDSIMGAFNVHEG